MPSIMAILAWLLQAPHYSVLREDRWGFRCSAQSLPRIWRMDWPRECRPEQVCLSQPIPPQSRHCLRRSGVFIWTYLQARSIQYSFRPQRSEEHTSELQSLMRISYAVFCLKKKNNYTIINHIHQ